MAYSEDYHDVDSEKLTIVMAESKSNKFAQIKIEDIKLMKV